MEIELEEKSDFLFYTGNDGSVNVQIIIKDDTVWSTQKSISEIFGTTKQNISDHLQNIFDTEELIKSSTVKKILTVQKEGKRDVRRELEFYNLDAIIAVGYRVNSYNATKFRIWATKILKDYLIKGFALDDERLKQGSKLFGKDYFKELLERIREIRASERRFYQKITDIYQQCSSDYDRNSPITQTFFATVQNKLEFAITQHTAAEIIKLRANSTKPNMGLTSWKNGSKGGKIQKSDVTVAKNYLDEKEIRELNRIVNMYLDYAENMAERYKLMTMAEWVKKLDAFLQFNEYDLLKNSGAISKVIAEKIALKEYEKYRIVQDNEYNSDFDKLLTNIKATNDLPSEYKNKNTQMSDFKQKPKGKNSQ